MSEAALWLVGGLDPTGGAGVLRDWAAARAVAPGLATRSVVTALTMQGHGAPARARPLSADELAWQLAEGPPAAAIKIGLVPADLVEVVTAFVRRSGVPAVLDPVLAATDGGALGSDPAALQPLIEACTLVTPNRAEANAIAVGDPVLLKNVGDDPDTVTDVLVLDGARTRYPRARQHGPDPRGTGCALATAIAAGLGTGRTLPDAVGQAIAWLDAVRPSA